MQDLLHFNKKIKVLFTDIDDTLTDDGFLPAESYSALWRLHHHGIQVIPVTGRPAGWCEMIARQWPVRGVIGENGGFYFCYQNKKMNRVWMDDEEIRQKNRKKLDIIASEVLKEVPGSALASDQFCRIYDLAIDFCEDIPALPKTEVKKIVEIFNRHGAIAKVSSIHVNGWFGSHDKLTMTKMFAEKEFGWSEVELKSNAAFSGDSPNDEPMFGYFPNSFAVANINQFISDIKSLPSYVAPSRGAHGFVQIADRLILTS